MTSMVGTALPPARDGNARPFPRCGTDLEFVRQPFGAAQSETEARPRGISVRHRQFHIGNAWPAIFENQAQSLACAVVQGLETDRTAAAMDQRVARQFA